MKILIYAGGLGNQMFQYAFYKASSLSHKELWTTTAWYSFNNSHNGYELKKVFNISHRRNLVLPFKLKRTSRKDKVQQLKEVQDSSLTKILRRFLYNNPFVKFYEVLDSKYNPEILNEKKFCIISGYFQNEKYFKSISDEIIKDFSFPAFSDDRNVQISEKMRKTNSVSIHVRRGDYCGNSLLEGIATTDYYKNAIDYIVKHVENSVFFIFSDDIEWCKQNLNIQNEHYFINWNKGSKSFRDMQLMSLCKHNIIPNSSFSWWGAWLNQNKEKIVIAPSKWVNDNSGLDFSDIIPSSWIRI